MARHDHNFQERLERDLAELKLSEILKGYREVLDEAARKGNSMLEVLATLIGLEQAVRDRHGHLRFRRFVACAPKRRCAREHPAVTAVEDAAKRRGSDNVVVVARDVRKRFAQRRAVPLAVC